METGYIIALCFFIAFALLVYLLICIGRENAKLVYAQQEHEYDQLYRDITDEIREFYVHPENKKLIKSHIERLERLPHKTPRRRKCLRINFC